MKKKTTDDMPYKIYYEGKIIAMFTGEHDRDVCIDAIREEHLDCTFKTEQTQVP